MSGRILTFCFGCLVAAGVSALARPADGPSLWRGGRDAVGAFDFEHAGLRDDSARGGRFSASGSEIVLDEGRPVYLNNDFTVSMRGSVFEGATGMTVLAWVNMATNYNAWGWRPGLTVYNDWPWGLVATQQVVNPSFTNEAATWTLGAGWALEDGRARATGATETLWCDVPGLSTGAWTGTGEATWYYEVELALTNVTAGGFVVGVGGSTNRSDGSAVTVWATGGVYKVHQGATQRLDIHALAGTTGEVAAVRVWPMGVVRGRFHSQTDQIVNMEQTEAAYWRPIAMTWDAPSGRVTIWCEGSLKHDGVHDWPAKPDTIPPAAKVEMRVLPLGPAERIQWRGIRLWRRVLSDEELRRQFERRDY